MKKAPIFGRGFLGFLRELKKHNHRDWFLANKPRYERDVLEPMIALVTELQEPLHKLCPILKVDPRPVGGSLFRIYRDTRFSKDKSPYKTYMAARFHMVRKGKALPLGFYLALGVDGDYLAGGSWQPEPPDLHRIRDRIAAEPAAWKRATRGGKFRDSFDAHHGGEQLKRVPPPYPSDHPCADDLRRKDFIAVAEVPATQLTRPDFLERVVGTYRAMMPRIHFLAGALKIQW